MARIAGVTNVVHVGELEMIHKLQPAFWTPKPDDDEDIVQGMTLRDYFAARALEAQLSCEEPDEIYNPDFVARRAYQFADAMLEARNA